MAYSLGIKRNLDWPILIRPVTEEEKQQPTLLETQLKVFDD